MLTKVTLKDTLCPDDAHTLLSRDESEYAGRWDAVWEEAVVLAEREVEPPSTSPGDNAAAISSSSNIPENNSSHPSHCKYNALVLIVGFFLLVAGSTATFSMEIVRAVVVCLAACFDFVAQTFKDWCCTVPLYLVFLLVSKVLVFTNKLILGLEVLVTEIVAGVAFLLCFLFGGPASASDWHQNIRRICHLIRWAAKGFEENCCDDPKLAQSPAEKLPSETPSLSGPNASPNGNEVKPVNGSLKYDIEHPEPSEAPKSNDHDIVVLGADAIIDVNPDNFGTGKKGW